MWPCISKRIMDIINPCCPIPQLISMWFTVNCSETYIILSCSKHITNSYLIYLCVVFKQVGVVLFENTVQYKILLRSDNHKCQFMKDLNALPVVTGGGTNAKGGNYSINIFLKCNSSYYTMVYLYISALSKNGAFWDTYFSIPPLWQNCQNIGAAYGADSSFLEAEWLDH